MASESEGSSPTAREARGGAAGGGAGAAGAAGGAGELRHRHSFKLRFGAQHEPGRSTVSLVKPLALPATVTDKFYRARRDTSAERRREQRAFRRVSDMFSQGPREKLARAATTNQEYGWHWEHSPAAGVRADDRRLRHHVRDSAWMKERLRVLTA